MEYYGVDYRLLSVSDQAALVSGLMDREQSRLYRLLTDTKVSTAEILLAGIQDRLSILLSAFSTEKVEVPLVTDKLLGCEIENERDEFERFNTGEEFLQKLNELKGDS